MNPKIKTYLNRLADSSKRPNSYLFFGPDGAGKKEAAFYFVSKLAGKAGDEDFLRKIEEKMHPDVIVVEPETVEDKKGRIREKEIAISQVREMQERIRFFPYELKYKFCLIKKAERLNAQAQNSLLKMLEEPTASTFFILLADDIDSVLATISSRCAALRFLKNDPPQWKAENRERLRNIFTEEIHEKFDYAQELAKNREEAITVLEDWEKIMAEGLKSLLSGGNRKEWEKVKITQELLQKNREAINRIQNSNANARTVLENFLLDMKWG